MYRLNEFVHLCWYYISHNLEIKIVLEDLNRVNVYIL